LHTYYRYKKNQIHLGKINAFSDLISTNCVTLLPGAAAAPL
jgi:hypothetical protein